MNPKFRIIALFCGILFLIVVGIGFLLPRHFFFEREIFIFAEYQKVFDTLLDLEEFQKWSPWNEYDPRAQIFFGEIKKGLNASFSWKGGKSGSGKIKIVHLAPLQEITALLEFEQGSQALVTWKVQKKEEGTQVIWRFQMDSGFDVFLRYLNYFFLEKMLARDYEKGLRNLKNYMETVK